MERAQCTDGRTSQGYIDQQIQRVVVEVIEPAQLRLLIRAALATGIEQSLKRLSPG